VTTIASDLPDWFADRQVQNVQAFVNDALVLRPPGNTVFGPFYVLPWAYLQLFVQSAAVMVGNLQFSTDSTFATLTAEFDFNAQATGAYSDVIPVCGPWARLNVVYTPGPGSAQENTLLVASQTDDPLKRTSSELYVLRAINQSVAGSGSFSVVSPVATSGRAQFCLTTNAVNWAATLNAVDQTGAAIAPLSILFASTGNVISPTAVALPPNQVQLTINNNDVGAKLFNYSVILER
jgi:hypothetical protein